ncbi:ion transporter [Actinoalloteichus caeruleus]|uniref:Voltage-gated sodium channel n=1 Tax=Actinoalloteichus caeruleus DSM 43889 TaxID=1120930 RepID=A0ABT1JHE9_ACTCY|nr:ion transporter [Actinoalloteichus caeruleus]MCP2331930.1 voltage-gated sodium channel [Actinoalloteichus caeruleus DSM 43889]
MALRDRVRAVVEARRFNQFIITVILVNAAVLGMETSPWLTSRYGETMLLIDHTAVAVFTVELLARLYVYRTGFFRSAWNWFDLIVVSVALVPTTTSFSVLRVLRGLRLISAVPAIRRIVSALFSAVPGLLSVLSLLLLVLYISAVISVHLFGDIAPELFGHLGIALFSLFKVLTTENWPDIADTVMVDQPMAWIFFVCYIVSTTFVVLNLLIAVLVSAVEMQLSAARWAEDQSLEAVQHAAVMAELRALRGELATLRASTGPGTAAGTSAPAQGTPDGEPPPAPPAPRRPEGDGTRADEPGGPGQPVP